MQNSNLAGESTVSKWHYNKFLYRDIKPCGDVVGRTHPILILRRRIWANWFRGLFKEDSEDYYYSSGLLPSLELANYLKSSTTVEFEESKCRYKSCILKLRSPNNKFFDKARINIIWKDSVSIKMALFRLIEDLNNRCEWYSSSACSSSSHESFKDEHFCTGLPLGDFDLRLVSNVKIPHRHWPSILQKMMDIPLDHSTRKLVTITVPNAVSNTDQSQYILVLKSTSSKTRKYIKSVISKAVKGDWKFTEKANAQPQAN